MPAYFLRMVSMELHLHFHEGVCGQVEYTHNGQLLVQLTGESTRERLHEIETTLTRIEGALSTVKENVMAVSQQTQQLITSVRNLEDAEDGVLRILDGLVQRMRDNSDDQQAILQLADEVEGRRTMLAAAVVANTPAADPGTGTGSTGSTGGDTTGTGTGDGSTDTGAGGESGGGGDGSGT